MTVLTATDRDALARAFAGDARLVVVSMCAAWCDTCNEFRVAYERIARSRPECAFVWLDIEDDAAIAGDIDVENFPTLAVFRNGLPTYFGVSLPHEYGWHLSQMYEAMDRGELTTVYAIGENPCQSEADQEVE